MSVIENLLEIELEKVDEDILSTDRFAYPDMGDYYLNAVDDPYYKSLQEAMKRAGLNPDGTQNYDGIGGEGLSDADIEEQLVNGNAPHATGFYLENPPVDTIGDYPDKGILYFKAKVDLDEEDMRMGRFDGDTIPFLLSSIDAGSPEATTKAKGGYNEIAESLGILGDDKTMSVRFVGIQAPEVAKWRVGTLKESEFEEQKTTMKYKDIKDFPERYSIIRSQARSLDEDVKLINIKDDNGASIWFEYQNEDAKNGKAQFEYLSSMDETDPVRIHAGAMLQRKLLDILNATGNEIYVVADAVSLAYNDKKYTTRFGADVNAFAPTAGGKLLYQLSQIEDYNRYKYTGYNQWGMDAYGRWLGAVYVKFQGQYINLAKYMITQSSENEVLPDFSDLPSYDMNGGMSSSAFNMHTYNYKDKTFYDIHGEISKEMDDRRRVQKAIFKMDFDEMKEWNVTIGDTTLFVPPTSIRSQTTTTYERLPIIRGKGSMTKGGQKVKKMIELTVFFNEERGINGYPFKDTLPNGTEVTYYMNGLRALIAQFKFTPFLPIENNYINGVLNTDAVTLVNMQLTTNPSYPRMIKAVLTLQEFDYTQYMPELPLDVDRREGGYYNPFSTVFNFELMRWYYQRPILLGNEVRHLGINSFEYMEAIQGHKTALMPMDFDESKFKIFIANEEHLKKMLQVKTMKTKNSTNRTTPLINDKEEGLIADLVRAYHPYMELEGDTGIDHLLKEIVATGPYQFDMFDTVDKHEGNPYFNMDFKKDGQSSQLAKSHINGLIGIVASRMYAAQDLDRGVNVALEKTYLKRAGDKLVIGMVFDMNSTHKTGESLQNVVKSTEGVIGEIKDEHVKDGKIVVEYEAPVKEKERTVRGHKLKELELDGKFELKKGDSARFLANLKAMHDKVEGGGFATPNDEINSYTDESDLMENLTYNEEPLGDIRISNIACVYGNTFTQVGLNGTEGFAAQYMGGQDAVIEVNFETTSAYSVGVLNGLPKLASYLVSTYKLVMPSAPIRFESDITRLFGISEVAIEQVDVTTVPGHPGLYNVSMRMVSVDRTMRSREGIDKINEFAYGGSTTTENIQNIKAQTYAGLNKRYGQAELYPDLELPTIDELERMGFLFLRHKFDKTRTYPDPDFYFTYGHILQSQVFREAIIRTDIDSYEMTWEDTVGGKVKTDVGKKEGIVEVEKNEQAEYREKVIEDAERFAQASSSKLINDYIDNTIPALNLLDQYNSQDVWEIGADARVLLMEKAYSDLLMNRNGLASSGKSLENSEWLASKMKPVDDVIGVIDEILSEPITSGDAQVWSNSDLKKFETYAQNVLMEPKWEQVFKTLGVTKKYKEFTQFFGKIAYAVASARTGKLEYKKDLDKSDYEMDPDYIGHMLSEQQDNYGTYYIKDIEDIAQAVEFSPFRLKLYYPADVEKITGEKVVYTDYRKKKQSDINTLMVPLDPYYAKATSEDIVAYKQRCVESPSFAMEAFLRLCLVWTKRMIQQRLWPNITMDLFREEFEGELRDHRVDEDEAGSEEGAEQLEQQIEAYLQFLEDGETGINNGKAFLLGALMCGEADLFTLISTRSFAELNAMKQQLTNLAAEFKEAKGTYVFLRKFLLALIPAQVVDGVEDLSTKFGDTIQDYRQAELERKYIEFAEDPNIYVRHSFYDMCAADMRGRMARAFPSFYMVLVDEGQEIGMYKLNDNFYNINAVAEIQVHRSRKIAADTARIVLANLYHSYTTDDEDKKVTYEYDPRDIYNSVFRPGEIYGREQEKRLRQQPLNRVKLTAGTRIHIRMGYGANAATLPVAFNGRITEINAGDVMELVAQGDGVELMNPILEDISAEEVKNEDEIAPWVHNLMINAETPKGILDGLLNTAGGYWKEWLREETKNWFKNPHKYGITNFGTTRITPEGMFKSGEVVQNIFEGIGKPLWGDLEEGKQGSWNMENAPLLSTDLLGKSAWDLLHFCASATPDFIVGLAPFGMRSTIFHGHPRYYYAFDYVLDEAGQIRYEKRKPYQQYHIVTSFSDIIKNSIKADNTRIKTNAIGTYKSTGIFMSESIKQTDRLFIDWDIYPEHQKSMIYDTQLWDKGAPLSLGSMKSFDRGVNWVKELFTEEADTTSSSYEGEQQDNKKIARRMTANALKESMKDMYAGEIVMFGIPSLKPHDRLIINDTYENMYGHVTVEAVTHSLTPDTGLTTTVVPDCISTVDDPFEKGARSVIDYVSAFAMIGYSSLLAGSLFLGKGLGPMTQLSSWAAGKAVPQFAQKLITNNSTMKFKEAQVIARGADIGAEITKWKRVGDAAARLLAGTSGGLPGVLAAAAWTVVEMGSTVTLGALMKREVDKKLKNSQVLTIFPLKHNGKVMTSGLTGEIGSVYGSVTYGRLGAIEKVFDYLQSDDSDKNGFLRGLADFFMNDATQEVIREHNLNIIGGTADVDIDLEAALQDSLTKAAADESQKIAGYKHLLVSPRININDEMEGESLGQAYERMAILDTRMIEAQTRIPTEFKYLGNDAKLKEMADNGFLRIAWKESPNNVDHIMIRFRGIDSSFKGYRRERGDGEWMYDLPFLKEDAVTVMKQILSRASYLNTSYDEKEGSNAIISVTSALIVGEENASLAGMGYSFTLEGDGKFSEYILPGSIEGLYKYNKEQYELGASINEEIFVYRDLGDNKFQISVLPPKV